MRPKITLEIEGVPGSHSVNEAAALVGAASPTLWFHVHRGVFGDWFGVKDRRLRVITGNDKAGNDVGLSRLAVTGGDRPTLRAALQRGCEFSTEADLQKAVGWLSRARRAAEDLKLVMAGKADLQVDYRGEVLVVRPTPTKPAKFQAPQESVEYEGAMAQRG